MLAPPQIYTPALGLTSPTLFGKSLNFELFWDPSLRAIMKGFLSFGEIVGVGSLVIPQKFCPVSDMQFDMAVKYSLRKYEATLGAIMGYSLYVESFVSLQVYLFQKLFSTLGTTFFLLGSKSGAVVSQ